MAAVLLPGFRVTDAPVAGAAALKLGNTKLLGIEVYTKYLYPLQIAAVLLLVAIIAAIALTLRRRKDSKYQNPSDQVRVRAADRMRVVKMQPVVELPDPVPAPDAVAAATGDKK
jgi:NADH-quinone oxidoreductase subunit J